MTHDFLKVCPGNGRCEAIIITWIVLMALLKAANGDPKLCILTIGLINRLHEDIASCWHDNYLPGLAGVFLTVQFFVLSWATCG